MDCLAAPKPIMASVTYSLPDPNPFIPLMKTGVFLVSLARSAVVIIKQIAPSMFTLKS